MPLVENNVLFRKGFYESVKDVINEKYVNDFSAYIICFDYLLTEQTNKTILTSRSITEKTRLSSLLETLYKTYGNIHINYIIKIYDDFLYGIDQKHISKIRSAQQKFLKGYHHAQRLDGSFNMTKGILRQEFIMWRNLFKKDSAEGLFVNDNIYTLYKF